PKQIQGEFQEILKALQEEWPSEELFLEKFADIEYGSSQQKRVLVKYVLSEINSTYGTGEHQLDFDEVNIEHILPQNPATDWGLSKKEIKAYVNKVGNLTLVSKRFNSRGGNKHIKEKLPD